MNNSTYFARSLLQRVLGRFRPGVAVVIVTGILVAGCGISLGKGSTTSTAINQVEIAQLFRQGLAYQNAGQLDLARNEYVQIIERDPLNQYAYYDLGVIYQDAGQTSASSTAYEKSLLINPNYTPALFNLAVIETVTAPSTAIALYQRLEQLKPNDASAYFNLGLLDLHVGSTLLGDQQLVTAVRLEPSLLSRIPAKLLPPSLRSSPTPTT